MSSGLQFLGTLGATAWLCAPLYAQIPVFQVATQGCAMAHCDNTMSGDDPLVAPSGPNAVVMAHDTLPAGSKSGLGCASNGSVVACSYAGLSGNNVVAYSNAGTRLSSSQAVLSAEAWASAPMVAPDGGVIAAAYNGVARFSSAGALLCSSPNPGGTPISPVLTSSGAVVLATRNGPVSAFNSTTGQLIGSLFVRQNPSSPTFFDTANTPCVDGNRVYISMQ